MKACVQYTQPWAPSRGGGCRKDPLPRKCRCTRSFRGLKGPVGLEKTYVCLEVQERHPSQPWKPGVWGRAPCEMGTAEHHLTPMFIHDTHDHA